MNVLHKLYEKVIIRYNEYAIKSVHNMKDLGSFDYSRENLQRAVDLVTTRSLDKLPEIEVKKSPFGKALLIVSFNDQKGNEFVALIYDYGDLYQDPETLFLFQYLKG